MKLEMGSARNTPLVPSPNIFGRSSVNGITMITLRSREKNIACLDFPNATKVDWAENCKGIIKKPKKYIRRAGSPFSINTGFLLNIFIKTSGKILRIPQAIKVYTILTTVINLMEVRTL